MSSTSDAASAEPSVEPASGEPPSVEPASVEPPSVEPATGESASDEPVQPVDSRESIRPTPSAAQAAAERPPVLASEALRRDLVPAAPAPMLIRRSAVVVGVLGACQALIWPDGRGLAIPIAGAFAAIAALSLAPMTYAARAASIATVAGSALGVAAFAEVGTDGRFEPLVLATGITVLSAALLFRAWHRGSWLARALTALGIAVCAGFLAMSEALRRLPIVDPSWQAWLPQVLQLFLVLLLFLSLLAFMDARSTGGCDAWAFSLLAWYVIFRAVEALALRYPAASTAADPAAAALAKLATENAGLHVAVPLLTGMFAIALAQLWAARAAARST